MIPAHSKFINPHNIKAYTPKTIKSRQKIGILTKASFDPYKNTEIQLDNPKTTGPYANKNGLSRNDLKLSASKAAAGTKSKNTKPNMHQQYYNTHAKKYNKTHQKKRMAHETF